MLGRKKKNVDPEVTEDLLDEQETADLDEDGVADELESDEIDDESDLEDDTGDEDDTDEWDELDASQDWRDDGPFDIDEVDLDDDPVNRVDFGTLILTPFDGMQLQLQVDQASGAVQTAMAMSGSSGLEVALFAAPRSGGLARTVRREMLEQAQSTPEAQAELAEGPFGTEVRRIIPVTTPDGQQGVHVSRTWLVEGPRWLLRGVLMGEVALNVDDATQHPFVEFFKNVIVRRGDVAMPQGDLIPMVLPDELKPQQ